jgi:hypothetical protein
MTLKLEQYEPVLLCTFDEMYNIVLVTDASGREQKVSECKKTELWLECYHLYDLRSEMNDYKWERMSYHRNQY